MSQPAAGWRLFQGESFLVFARLKKMNRDVWN